MFPIYYWTEEVYFNITYFTVDSLPSWSCAAVTLKRVDIIDARSGRTRGTPTFIYFWKTKQEEYHNHNASFLGISDCPYMTGNVKISSIMPRKTGGQYDWWLRAISFEIMRGDGKLNKNMWGVVCEKIKQGSHRSTRFEFPDFPWHFSVIFPDFPWPRGTNLRSIAWRSERSEEKFCTYKQRVLQIYV